MQIDDRTDFNGLVDRLLSLLDGLNGTYTCLCSRRMKLGTTAEVKDVCEAIRKLQVEKPKQSELQRFNLLEIDDT